MRRVRSVLLTVLGAILVAVLAAPIRAQAPAAPPAAPSEPEDHDHHHHPPTYPEASPERQAEIERAHKYFSDVVLFNQDGEPMRFYSDLLYNHVVVINPFFTTCTGVCPLLTQKMVAIQERLSDRLGKDLFLISITVDPETDTPDKLKAYAERHKARPGWYFLGGPKQNVDWALYKLGQYVEEKEAHTNIIIIGNESTGHWRKVLGLDPPAALIHSVEEVLDEAK